MCNTVQYILSTLGLLGCKHNIWKNETQFEVNLVKNLATELRCQKEHRLAGVSFWEFEVNFENAAVKLIGLAENLPKND